jgi:hypothetical protein
MKIYFAKMSSAVKICYIVSIAVFALSMCVSFLVLTNVVQAAASLMMVILSVVFGVVVIASSFVVSLMMSKAVISTSHEHCGNTELSFHIKRMAFIMLYLAGSHFVAYEVGGQVLSATVGLLFFAVRNNHFPIFSFIMKAILFALIWLVFAILARGFGHGDSSDKEFNPHLLIVSIVLALTLMMPGTVYDTMYENEDRYGAGQGMDGDKGKIAYNAQAIFSQNVNLYADHDSNDINENFRLTWAILSIILSSLVQIAIGFIAYKKGRDGYYKRHPRLLDEHFPTK